MRVLSKWFLAWLKKGKSADDGPTVIVAWNQKLRAMGIHLADMTVNKLMAKLDVQVATV